MVELSKHDCELIQEELVGSFKRARQCLKSAAKYAQDLEVMGMMFFVDMAKKEIERCEELYRKWDDALVWRRSRELIKPTTKTGRF